MFKRADWYRGGGGGGGWGGEGGGISPDWYPLSPENGMIRQATRSEGRPWKEGEDVWLLVFQLQLQFSVEFLHVLDRVFGASCRIQVGVSS